MSKMEIEVYSDETNAAVVKMPGRNFPGLVVQSDKLIFLAGKSNALYEQAQKSGNAELIRLAGNLNCGFRNCWTSTKEIQIYPQIPNCMLKQSLLIGPASSRSLWSFSGGAQINAAEFAQVTATLEISPQSSTLIGIGHEKACVGQTS